MDGGRLPGKQAQGRERVKAGLRVFKGEEASVRRAALQQLLEAFCAHLRLAGEKLLADKIERHIHAVPGQNEPADLRVQIGVHMQPRGRKLR